MKQLKITKFPALDYAGNEAFNTLSTNLSFAGASVKKIMVTSCHAAEGKSYLSMNLMRTLAQRGIKVALVDADLRRSMVNSDYGLKYEDGRSDGKGLSHFLAGMVGMDEVIYQTDIPNAIMVPVGRDVPNPLALLTNSHFAELLDMLARMADYVIVDAPPVGVVIDAAEIAKACDGTLIAVNYNDVSRQELLDVKQQIEQTGCPILGTVLNQVDYDNYMGRKYYKSYSKYGKYGYYRKYYKRSHENEADVRNVLEHLRYPPENAPVGIKIQCFGNFEIFVGGRALAFKRSKSKELLAYLVDRNGATCTNGEMLAVLWEDKPDTASLHSHLRNLIFDLSHTLEDAGVTGLLIRGRSTLALDTSKVDCDYYNFLRGSRSATNSYRGEYMTQYSWAEVTRSALRQQANVQKTASIPSYYVPPTGF